MGSAIDRDLFSKHGPTSCPLAPYLSKDLNFRHTRISDGVVVSVEVSPAGLINLVHHCFWIAINTYSGSGVYQKVASPQYEKSGRRDYRERWKRKAWAPHFRESACCPVSSPASNPVSGSQSLTPCHPQKHIPKILPYLASRQESGVGFPPIFFRGSEQTRLRNRVVMV